MGMDIRTQTGRNHPIRTRTLISTPVYRLAGKGVRQYHGTDSGSDEKNTTRPCLPRLYDLDYVGQVGGRPGAAPSCLSPPLGVSGSTGRGQAAG